MLGYRTYFTVEGTDGPLPLFETIHGQVHAWLRGKHFDADAIRPGTTARIGGSAQATLAHDATDDAESMLFALREENRSGTWMTKLVAHNPRSSRKKPWVWLDIDGPEQKTAKVPKLARHLLDVLDARDAGAPLHSEARTLCGDDVDDLMYSLSHHRRRGPIFLAGSDETLPLEPWRDMVTDLLAQTVGLSAGFVLDPEATREFNRKAGRDHAVEPGTLRTFALEVEFDSELDARRHRWLGTPQIVAESRGRNVHVLGARARALSLSRPVPRQAIRVEQRLLERADNDLLSSPGSNQATYSAHVDSLQSREGRSLRTPPRHAPALDIQRGEEATSNTIAEEAGSYLALIQALRDELSIVEPQVGDIKRLARAASTARQAEAMVARKDDELAILQQRVSDLTRVNAEHVRRLEDEQVAHAETADQLSTSDKLARALRIRMQKIDHGDLAWSPLDDSEKTTPAPDSFVDLLGRFDELTYVTWTGDASATIDLDVLDPMGLWAAKTWDALKALDDCARARTTGEFSGSVDSYLQNTPTDRCGYPANRHARDESEEVKSNEKYAESRRFHIPTGGEDSERRFMGAHFKIANSGTISPRMHYLDAWHTDGRIYVGYIGRHLPTRRTN